MSDQSEVSWEDVEEYVGHKIDKDDKYKRFILSLLNTKDQPKPKPILPPVGPHLKLSELRRVAYVLGVERYSKMSKPKLIEELQKRNR